MFGLPPGMPGFSGDPVINEMWEYVSSVAGTDSSEYITLSSLDGDTDKMYRVVGYLDSTGQTSPHLQFNNTDVHVQDEEEYDFVGVTETLTTGSNGSMVGSNSFSFFSGMIDILIFADRLGSSEYRGGFATLIYNGSSDQRWKNYFVFRSGSSNLTSLRLYTSFASNYWDTNSTLWLYKLANPDG